MKLGIDKVGFYQGPLQGFTEATGPMLVRPIRCRVALVPII